MINRRIVPIGPEVDLDGMPVARAARPRRRQKPTFALPNRTFTAAC